MFKKIVWATDASKNADQALPVARELAAESGGELIAVHCVELAMPGKASGVFPVNVNEGELKQSIKRQIETIAADGTPARMVVTTAGVGEAAKAIADTARDEGADVIVVGTRGRGQFAGLLLGSVAHRLMHVAPCPVLAIPTRRHHSDTDAGSGSEQSSQDARRQEALRG